MNRIALELDQAKIMSCCRAQTHILNFLKANAHSNNRDTVVEDDLRLFKLTLPLYYGTDSGKVDVKVREIILQQSIQDNKIKGTDIEKELHNEYGITDRQVRNVLEELKNKTVHFSNISRNYEYWL